MDTKLKKWKPVVSFAAFFLGVSLTLSALLTAASFWLRGDGHGVPANLFETDYQRSDGFREAVGDYLENFLAMATCGPLSSYAEEAAGQSDWVGGYVWENSYGGWQYNWDYEFTPEEREKFAEQAENAHKYYREDKNVLYSIVYDGALKFTNTEEGISDRPEDLPEGYNFLLVFDGKGTSIYKDGEKLDVYGDGYYREGDWLVPGYRNLTVDEETARASVRIAAAKEPVLYLHRSFSSRSGGGAYSQLYWLQQNLREVRERWVSIGVELLAGLFLLLAASLPLHGEKTRADRAVARFTGHLWFEGKLLLVLSAAVSLALPLLSNLDLRQVPLEDVFISGRFYLSELLYSWELGTVPCLLAFWAAYFFINDLRYNRKPWENALFSVAQMKYPFQKRARNRFLLVIGVGLLTAVFTAVEGLYFIYESSLGLGAVNLFGALIALLLLLWVAQAVQVKKAIRETGLLVDRIDAIHDGDLSRPLELPRDSDLSRTAEKLRDIQQGMRAAMEEQIRSERTKVELITNVSHDIKTPLTSIISYVDLLKQEEELPEHVKEYVQILDGKAQRLRSMVQDVFAVSKAATGDLPVELEILDLGKLLRQTLADMSEQIDASAVTIRPEIPEEPVEIRADGKRLYRVFQNLVQNALQYSLEGSRVYVTLRVAGTVASASVKNTSKQEIPSDVDFTERFFRGDSSRSDGGSGLGLSIARTFTEACGGRFHVEAIADLFVAAVEFEKAPRQGERPSSEEGVQQ